MELKSYYKLLIFVALISASILSGQTAYFADGYHGGIYGHYPKWQAGFMVDKLNEFPQWKINLEIEPETWDMVRASDYDNYQRLKQYYTSSGPGNRIDFVNPSYAQPYCYNISGESIIRQFTYGMALLKEYFPDVRLDTYSCEEPCFTSCLPQLLSSLGFKYAVLRCPDTCWGGYTSAYGRELVNWKSSDGSSILTVPRYECEGLTAGSTWQTESWDNSSSFIKKCFASGIKYPVGMCFQDAGWSGGPWLGGAVKNYYQPSEYVTWTRYIESVKSKVDSEDWNFTIEDVKPGLVWGSQVLQKLAREIRHTENKLVMAEKIATLGKLYHGIDYPSDDLDEAWRCLMLSQHHDCWIVPYNGRPGGNWATNVTDWTEKANAIAEKAIQNVSLGAAESLDNSALSVIVFNTLGKKRTALAEVVLPDSIFADSVSLYDSNDKKAAAQVIDNGKKLTFMASVPAMGYACYSIRKSADDSGKSNYKIHADNSIEVNTGFYNAVIDPAAGGAISSLIAKKAGNKQLVAGNQGLNSLKGYFYQEEKYITSSDQPATVSILESGALLTRIMVENKLADNPYTQIITFYNDSPVIDFELNIDWQGQPGIGAYSQYKNYKAQELEKAFYNDKYKLQVCFPIGQTGERVFKNAPFDVCESSLENTYYDSWDKIKHNVILNWVDVTDRSGQFGVALFSDHTTSYINSKEMPLGLTIQYAGRGLWGRDYKVDGPTHIRYAIMPHIGLWDQYGVSEYSSSWNEPLAGYVVDGIFQDGGKSLLDIQTDGVELVSIVSQDDRANIRLFNAESASDEVCVNLNVEPESIELVELNGEVIETIKPVRHESGGLMFKLSIPRYGVRTICIK